MLKKELHMPLTLLLTQRGDEEVAIKLICVIPFSVYFVRVVPGYKGEIATALFCEKAGIKHRNDVM
jgi:hypothetical protein